MWMVCSRMRITPVSRNLIRIAAAATVTGLAAWGLREAGLPTVAWVAAAAALYAVLVIAFGTVRIEELRTLLRKEEA
jgi:hypothetical protein